MPISKVTPSFEWAIKRLINAAHRDQLTSVQLGFTEATNFFVGHMSIQDKDGNWSYYWCDDGDWYEHVEVE